MKISVCITSFNQKSTLIEAIDSVLAQTLKPSQIILVDDCSTDGSQEIIAAYKSRYPHLITTILHAQNQGVAQARAHALQVVSGEYVTYVDGDDRYLPPKLEKEAALLAEQPHDSIACSNSYYINEEGQRIGTWITNKQPPQGNVFAETLTRQFPRGNLFRMELLSYSAWQVVGFHDPNLVLLEDWDMRIRLSKHYPLVYWDEPLTEIRVHNKGLSNLPNARKLEAFDTIWQKNQGLLADMPPEQQRAIRANMDSLYAVFLRRQAKEMLGAYALSPHGSKAEAWAYFQESWRYDHVLDLDLLLGLMLPTNLYGRFRQTLRTRSGRSGKI